MMFAVGDPVTDDFPDILKCDRIVNFHDRTGFQQAVNQDQRWSFTDIIGPRFKAQSPDCDRAPGQVTAEVIEQFSKQDLLLLVIRFIDSSQNTRLDAMFGSQRRESPDVFRKTRTPVSDARKQKRKSNPSIVTDAFANFVNVRSDPFADICHLIDKTPHLAPQGYTLVGGRLLPGERGPAAQFMYQDVKGQRLTLYVRINNEVHAQTAFRFAQEKGVGVFYWLDGRIGYALSGDTDRSELLRVADAVYQQLNP